MPFGYLVGDFAIGLDFSGFLVVLVAFCKSLCLKEKWFCLA